MKVKISIESDNAAMQGFGGGWEVETILRNLADIAHRGQSMSKRLKESNGNTIGRASMLFDPEE